MSHCYNESHIHLVNYNIEYNIYTKSCCQLFTELVFMNHIIIAIFSLCIGQDIETDTFIYFYLLFVKYMYFDVFICFSLLKVLIFIESQWLNISFVDSTHFIHVFELISLHRRIISNIAIYVNRTFSVIAIRLFNFNK